MSKKRLLLLAAIAAILLLYVFRNQPPINALTEKLAPVYKTVKGWWSGFTENTGNIPLLGGALTTGIGAVVALFRSRVNTLKSSAMQEIQNAQTQLVQVHNQKTRVERAYIDSQNQLQSMKQNMEAQAQQYAGLTQQLQTVQQELAQKQQYIQQLQAEKNEAQRWVRQMQHTIELQNQPPKVE